MYLTINTNLANKIGLKQATLIEFLRTPNNDWKHISIRELERQMPCLGKQNRVHGLLLELEYQGFIQTCYMRGIHKSRAKAYRVNLEKLIEVMK